MKKIISLAVITIVLCFTACKQNDFDKNKAAEVCEKAIKLIDNRNYSELANMYTDDFKTSETAEVRTEKFDKILNVIGRMKSDSLITTKNRTDEDYDQIVFTYKVITEHITVNEAFTITKESGDYKIAQIDIQQQQKSK